MIRPSTATDFVSEYHYRVLKSGKIAKNPTLTMHYFTPLRTCCICKRISTPKNISDRTFRNVISDWYNPFSKIGKERRYYIEGMTLLCVSCWNKATQICTQDRLLIENIELVTQLTTWLYHERKKSKYNN